MLRNRLVSLLLPALTAGMIALAGPAGTAAAFEGEAPQIDSNRVLAQVPIGQRWIDHLENDLMRFWAMETALGDPLGHFPTYRCNDGSLFDAAAPCPELADPIPGIVWLDREFTRSVSRQVYGYGIAFHMTGNPEYLDYARAGVDYITTTLLDDQGNGGAYSYLLGEAEEPSPARLERRSQDLAYALTGLGFYYYLTRDPAVLDHIVDVKEYIFATYYEDYLALMRWVIEPSPDGDRPGQIELVAYLDQIYAYMLWLTPALPADLREEWEGDLHTMASDIMQRFYSPRVGLFWGAVTAPSEMRLETDHVDFGHSVKTMWMIYTIGRMTGDLAMVEFGRNNAAAILERAYLEETGSWARRPLNDGTLDHDKEWWILAELDQVAATLALIDPAYARYLPHTYSDWFVHMVDHEHGGIWHWVDAETNQPDIRFPKQHSWKNALHSFEHALIGYLTGQQLHGLPITLHFAFVEDPNLDDPAVRRTINPYVYRGPIDRDRSGPGETSYLVTFSRIH